jgi:hypothetical protein
VSGSRVTNPSHVSGSRVTNPSHVSGSPATNPSHVSGSRVTNPSHVSGSRVTNPSHVSGSPASSLENLANSNIVITTSNASSIYNTLLSYINNLPSTISSSTPQQQFTPQQQNTLLTNFLASANFLNVQIDSDTLSQIFSNLTKNYV